LEKDCIYVGNCWIGIVVRGVTRDAKIDKKNNRRKGRKRVEFLGRMFVTLRKVKRNLIINCGPE
jgi:hypothetical protein